MLNYYKFLYIYKQKNVNANANERNEEHNKTLKQYNPKNFFLKRKQ